jgi:signal peptidase II
VPDAPPAARPGLAGKAWFWIPILPLVALDLWSKAWAFDYVPAHGEPLGAGYRDEVVVWSSWVSFHLVNVSNRGTIWGLFQDWTLPLVVARIVAVFVITYVAIWRITARQRVLQLLLGLVMAGALGNLYDNLTQPGGGVRDFLLFFVGTPLDRTTFPAFNVADSCITVGAITLVLLMLRHDLRVHRARRAAA